jgi:di/tricarboxylate transporter
VRLQAGDSLLLEGTESAMVRIRESRDFLMLQDVKRDVPRRSRSWIAMGILALVVVLASLNAMPIAVLALAGAVIVVLAGCLDAEDAYESIDWQIVMLIYGMLALGLALEKTGGVHVNAEAHMQGMGRWGPYVMLSTIFLVASLMTTFLSNNAVAVLFAPIVVDAAASFNVDARPFLIAVAVGASACFATPIGYQTNTLVYGAGGYHFKDFVKVGLPLNLIFWILATVLIPLLWPFEVIGRSADLPTPAELIGNGAANGITEDGFAKE